MDTILEMILEAVWRVILIFPGAFVRWCFTGFRKSYNDLLFDDSELNVLIGILTTFVTVLGIVWLMV